METDGGMVIGKGLNYAMNNKIGIIVNLEELRSLFRGFIAEQTAIQSYDNADVSSMRFELFLQWLSKRRESTNDNNILTFRVEKRAGLPSESSKDLMDRRPTPDEECAYISDDGRGNGAGCFAVENDPIHDKSMGYGGYHEFVRPTSAAARSAQPSSSTNGAGVSSIPSSEGEMASAQVAAGGSND